MRRINQRFFLKIISLGIAIFAFSGFNCVAESKTRPNILIYIADDQHKSSLGCYGANPSHTPH